MTAEELWEKLHENPELSNEEHRTKEILRQFLSEETDAAVRDGSAYVTALHEEGAPETIAVRADMDAIPRPDGTPFHGCGHDGHMAMRARPRSGFPERGSERMSSFSFSRPRRSGRARARAFPFFPGRGSAAFWDCTTSPGNRSARCL